MPAKFWFPVVLITVLSTCISSALAVIPSPPTTLNVLLAVISPPPVRPVPAVNETPLWLICSFVTKPAKLSCCISLSTAWNAPLLKETPLLALK